MSFHSGCCGASAFTRSKAKSAWKYIGCSAQSVPSLSNMAMRSASGTKSGEPAFVTFATKATMDCLAVPSFHEGSGSAACRRPPREERGSPKRGSRSEPAAEVGVSCSMLLEKNGPHPPSEPVRPGRVEPLRATKPSVSCRSAACSDVQHLVEAEAADLLARRELLERGEELPDVLLRRHEQEEAVDPPLPVLPAVLGVLERIGAQVEDPAARAASRTAPARRRSRGRAARRRRSSTGRSAAPPASRRR